MPLLRAELFDLGGQLLLAGDELLLLVLEALHLGVEILELLLDPGFPLQRLPGEILAACCESLAGRTSDAIEHLTEATQFSKFRLGMQSVLRPGSVEPSLPRLVLGAPVAQGAG